MGIAADILFPVGVFYKILKKKTPSFTVLIR